VEQLLILSYCKFILSGAVVDLELLQVVFYVEQLQKDNL
jgi:hypothetical protein